jgi:hypothetical protein
MNCECGLINQRTTKFNSYEATPEMIRQFRMFIIEGRFRQ